MSDGIIDLTQYLEREDPADERRATFALWGADDERSRFALPLWRAIYLAQGDRGGILWEEEGDRGVLRPFVVLDLGREPARTDFSYDMAAPVSGDAPAVHDGGGSGLGVYLGRRDGRLWHLLVGECPDRSEAVPPTEREDILFLAGECAGLLFLRDFADEAGSESGS